MNKDNINEFASFDEYLRQGEPSQKESAENWKTAIGLQAVDGLQPSAYLIDVAKRNIEGEITLDETRKLIDSYYQSKTVRTPKDEDEERQIRFQPTSQRFSPARPLPSIPTDMFPCTEEFSREYSSTQEKSANTIFPRKNGCSKEIP